MKTPSPEAGELRLNLDVVPHPDPRAALLEEASFRGYQIQVLSTAWQRCNYCSFLLRNEEINDCSTTASSNESEFSQALLLKMGLGAHTKSRPCSAYVSFRRKGENIFFQIKRQVIQEQLPLF